jgi:hypothetical protein
MVKKSLVSYDLYTPHLRVKEFMSQKAGVSRYATHSQEREGTGMSK